MATLWNDAEEAVLIQMFMHGATTKEVAVALGRTQEAISNRRMKMIREDRWLKS